MRLLSYTVTADGEAVLTKRDVQTCPAEHLQRLLYCAPSGRDSERRQTPMRYHLFLSHCWKWGQDQVANVKSSLQLMVPDVAVFLDVVY